MTDDFQKAVDAARFIRDANARMGNGKDAAWTPDDCFDFASSLAAQNGMAGKCPICAKEVFPNSSARIAIHMDGGGKMCVAAGQWFHIAVTR